ncbi:MAG TPA: PaaI family thioesterase [Ramlibacter sp.]|nr:PaaI family thioesterase [Ramlibacter sp.]
MNPDHTLLLEFAAQPPGEPRAITTNPLAIDLGATLIAADAQAGTLSLGFAPDARFVQGNGAVQGGIVAAMLDFATAFAVLLQLPPERSAVTAELNLQFMRAAKAGRFVAHARVRRRGGKLAFAAADLVRADDETNLIASATATLPVLEITSA